MTGNIICTGCEREFAPPAESAIQEEYLVRPRVPANHRRQAPLKPMSAAMLNLGGTAEECLSSLWDGGLFLYRFAALDMDMIH